MPRHGQKSISFTGQVRARDSSQLITVVKRFMPAKTESQPVIEQPQAASWTFLSNHAHVLLCIASHEDIRLRDVATHIGITERAVQRIVADLEQEGYLLRTKNGRRNQYQLYREESLKHPLESHRVLEDILSLADGAIYQPRPSSESHREANHTPRLRHAGI